MEVDVCYADGLVGDGDAEILVGSPWTTTLLLEPIDPEPSHVPDSGGPQASLHLRPSPERSPGLHPLEGEPGGYEFVADTTMEGVLVREERRSWLRTVSVHLPCSVLAVADLRVAITEECQGRVHGVGRLWHDTYVLDDEPVRRAVTQEFTVTRIRFVAHTHRRVGDRDVAVEGYRALVDVDTTHAWRNSSSPPSGRFLITVDTS